MKKCEEPQYRCCSLWLHLFCFIFQILSSYWAGKHQTNLAALPMTPPEGRTVDYILDSYLALTLHGSDTGALITITISTKMVHVEQHTQPAWSDLHSGSGCEFNKFNFSSSRVVKEYMTPATAAGSMMKHSVRLEGYLFS